MERGWLETIQLLGLDVQVAVVVVMLALVPVARLIVRLADGVGQDRASPAQPVPIAVPVAVPVAVPAAQASSSPPPPPPSAPPAAPPITRACTAAC